MTDRQDAGASLPRDWTSLVGRFAWPAAVVAVAAMTFGYLRDSKRLSATSEVRVEHEGATIVRELRSLSRLETSALHLEKVIELADHQKRLHGLVEADDKVLFVAVGEAVLGVDLSRVADGDLRFDRASGIAYVELPPPELLSTRFDEARSYVHARSTDTLARRNEGLEAAARREAREAPGRHVEEAAGGARRRPAVSRLDRTRARSGRASPSRL